MDCLAVVLELEPMRAEAEGALVVVRGVTTSYLHTYLIGGTSYLLKSRSSSFVINFRGVGSSESGHRASLESNFANT